MDMGREGKERNERKECKDYEEKSLKGALRRANDLGAKLVLIIGEDELKKGVVTLKDMVSGEQREVKQDELVNYVTHSYLRRTKRE